MMDFQNRRVPVLCPGDASHALSYNALAYKGHASIISCGKKNKIKNELNTVRLAYATLKHIQHRDSKP